MVFGKLRQGSGSVYFINAQQVLQRVTLRKSKLCLDLGVDLDDIEIGSGHSCSKCVYLLNDDKTMDVSITFPV